MASDKKISEIKNLTDGLIYKPSIVESELEKRLKKLGHPLKEAHLVTKGYDDGGSFSGRGFFFYLARKTNNLDRKGTRITYRKGAWKNKRTFGELVREEIDKSKYESIKLGRNKEVLSLDFRFVSGRLVETLNSCNYECVQYLKKAYTSHFLEPDLKDKKIHLSEIRQDLISKNPYDILDFIISSIGRASRN